MSLQYRITRRSVYKSGFIALRAAGEFHAFTGRLFPVVHGKYPCQQILERGLDTPKFFETKQRVCLKQAAFVLPATSFHQSSCPPVKFFRNSLPENSF
jgi:hypothetical protein